jgi:hypothetical protein
MYVDGNGIMFILYTVELSVAYGCESWVSNTECGTLGSCRNEYYDTLVWSDEEEGY